MAQTHHFDAILFDMDGTLVDSTAGVVGAWQLFAETYAGINVEEILSCGCTGWYASMNIYTRVVPASHGVRTVENLRIHCGITDTVELEREAERFEAAIVSSANKDGRSGIVKLPGVDAIMKDLQPGAKVPKPVWAICTSATRSYAKAALSAAGIVPPDVFVASEDVAQGKPAPDPYLLGAEKCGVNPTRCLVVEDAPAGIRSGKAAGAKVLGLLTTHTKDQVDDASPDFVVKNLASVTMKISSDGGVDVTIST